ncbi:hypothetical protein [Bacteriovorax sp. Seq25_V]|uniref:hypothetical protein n=1 Tax=Bacteriovorax sp. Seq25_V TaxID=1201288 RepID=UPI000389FE88|nr:hypothetical protein [Bacteriovorax sp. Seq25_V]EQC47491.1 hypothetical protein M900_0650 [Bacteriovorax sp. Seq25_V]
MKVLLAIVISFSAFSFSEHMTPMQKLMFNMELKAKYSGKYKSKPSPKRNCVEDFQKAKAEYNTAICDGEARIMEVGMISGKKFTRDQIENMPAGHPHLKSTVRGTNKLINYAVLGGRPSYPHSSRDCENFFSEEVEVITIDGKECREIKFHAPELGGETYSQIYCEDDYSLYISFN